LELAWRGYPWRFSLHSSEGALCLEEGRILRRRGAFIILQLLTEERRTCQIRMRSDALGEESLGASFCGERLSVSGSVYLL
jgi:hypothetical protein